MIKESIIKALNRQINREFYSSYLYLSMASYFESINLSGFAHWMHLQTHEEMEHALKMHRFLIDRGGRAELQDVEAPPSEWKSPIHIFEEVYKHEKAVTAMIHELVNLARKEKDHATEVFLQWFISEQVEEEASANTILQKLRMAGETDYAYLMMDRELAQRK